MWSHPPLRHCQQCPTWRSERQSPPSARGGLQLHSVPRPHWHSLPRPISSAHVARCGHRRGIRHTRWWYHPVRLRKGQLVRTRGGLTVTRHHHSRSRSHRPRHRHSRRRFVIDWRRLPAADQPAIRPIPRRGEQAAAAAATRPTPDRDGQQGGGQPDDGQPSDHRVSPSSRPEHPAQNLSEFSSTCGIEQREPPHKCDSSSKPFRRRWRNPLRFRNRFPRHERIRFAPVVFLGVCRTSPAMRLLSCCSSASRGRVQDFPRTLLVFRFSCGSRAARKT